MIKDIIFGAGNYGKEILSKYIEEKENIVFYDNDRRKWGKRCCDIEIINLDKLLELVRIKSTRLIIASRAPSALNFIKDIRPECSVFAEKEDKLSILNINEIKEFIYDNSREVGTKNLEKYAKELEESDNKIAYEHAKTYISYKEKHLELPEIYSIEFTNNCNLKCPNCPNSTANYYKGYMNDSVFKEILKYLPPYKEDVVSVHGIGEPLLHPKFIQYLEKLAELGINICVSTNGILLEGDLRKSTLDILTKLNKSILYVSFHTNKSVENWYKTLSELQNYPKNNLIFRGQILEHNEKEAVKWLNEIGIENPKEHPYIRYITSHSFAGNVLGRKKFYQEVEVKNRIRNCYFLRNRKVVVMWDGTIHGCCLDSDGEQKVGNIFEFEKITLNPAGYNLCRNCDPDWPTQFQ